MSHAARVAAAMEAHEAQPDMFVSALVEDARAAVEAATDARDLAERKVRCAPHGSLKSRLKAFSDATHELMKAEGRLGRVLREAGRSSSGAVARGKCHG
jgi:hypothetical protein